MIAIEQCIGTPTHQCTRCPNRLLATCRDTYQWFWHTCYDDNETIMYGRSAPRSQCERCQRHVLERYIDICPGCYRNICEQKCMLRTRRHFRMRCLDCAREDSFDSWSQSSDDSGPPPPDTWRVTLPISGGESLPGEPTGATVSSSTRSDEAEAQSSSSPPAGQTTTLHMCSFMVNTHQPSAPQTAAVPFPDFPSGPPEALGAEVYVHNGRLMIDTGVGQQYHHPAMPGELMSPAAAMYGLNYGSADVLQQISRMMSAERACAETQPNSPERTQALGTVIYTIGQLENMLRTHSRHLPGQVDERLRVHQVENISMAYSLSQSSQTPVRHATPLNINALPYHSSMPQVPDYATDRESDWDSQGWYIGADEYPRLSREDHSLMTGESLPGDPGMIHVPVQTGPY